MTAAESPDAQKNRRFDYEQRLIRLETLFETVATKADLAAMRIEIEKVRGDLSIEIQKTRTWVFAVIFGFQAAGVAATVTILRLLGGP